MAVLHFYLHILQKSSTFARKLENYANDQTHRNVSINKNITVVAAVIFDEQGRIFATQRGYGEWKDWWEFPGGKMESGETPQQALRREIHEELDAEIEVGELLRTIDYDYPDFHLTMHCFKCKLARSHVTLLEHEAAKWLAPNELQSVKWLPADEDLIEELSR